MSTPQPRASQVLAALLAIVGILIVAVLGLRWLLHGVQKQVAAALVAGLAAVLGSVLTIVLGRRSEQKKESDRKINEHRLPAYEEFLKFFLTTLMKLGKGIPMDDEEFEAAMAKFTPELMIWGSDKLIKRWAIFRTTERTGIDKLLEFEEIILALREDFGHKNTNLVKGDVLTLFINDVRETLAQQAAPMANKSTTGSMGEVTV